MTAPKRELETVIADWRSDAATLRRHGDARQADLLERCADEAAAAAEDWLLWLSEGEAALRAGRSVAWIRGRFEQLRREGHARQTGRATRIYRACAIPRRANTITAAERGRDAARALGGAA